MDLWLHAEHLIVDGEKMSKSKGNFFTLDDVLARRRTIRSPCATCFLSVPYRKKLNFTWDALTGAAAAVERIKSAVARLDDAAAERLGEAGRISGGRARGEVRGRLLGRPGRRPQHRRSPRRALHLPARSQRRAGRRLARRPASAAAAAAAIRQADGVLGILPPEGRRAPGRDRGPDRRPQRRAGAARLRRVRPHPPGARRAEESFSRTGPPARGGSGSVNSAPPGRLYCAQVRREA